MLLKYLAPFTQCVFLLFFFPTINRHSVKLDQQQTTMFILYLALRLQINILALQLLHLLSTVQRH